MTWIVISPHSLERDLKLYESSIDKLIEDIHKIPYSPDQKIDLPSLLPLTPNPSSLLTNNLLTYSPYWDTGSKSKTSVKEIKLKNVFIKIMSFVYLNLFLSLVFLNVFWISNVKWQC